MARWVAKKITVSLQASLLASLGSEGEPPGAEATGCQRRLPPSLALAERATPLPPEVRLRNHPSPN
jgi:hypothetical protein